MSSLWGKDKTEFFFSLAPANVIDAVEKLGFHCTGSCFALNSYENRVYEVELEEDETNENLHPIHRRRVVKFYRPGRWTKEQIQEEHDFLADLEENEVPVVNVIKADNGSTIHLDETTQLFYTIFPKVGGRIPQEPTDDQYLQIGRLIARLHNVGEVKKAKHRLSLSVDSFGRSNLFYLLENDWIEKEYRARYEKVADQIFDHLEPVLSSLPAMRIHGDCHLNNLLEQNDRIFFLDFDDMVSGPAIQDLWMLVPGHSHENPEKWNLLFEGYEQMRPFPYDQRTIVEGLRSLRMIHYAAWLARRWEDPAFPKAFPFFGTRGYWDRQTNDLEEQIRLLAENLDPAPTF